MRNIWTIMKKEFDRFFKDKRMVVSTLLLPGIMIYFVYSIMGTAMGSQFMTEETYVYKMEVVNMPATLETVFTEDTFDVTKVEAIDFDTLANRISDKELDLAVVFSENFDSVVANVGTENTDIDIYYNSTVTASSEAYAIVSATLDSVENSIWWND